MPDADDLVQVLDSTLADWLAKSGGGMVTGSYLIVEYVDGDGVPSWIYATTPDQNMGKTLGLIEWAKGCATYELNRYLQDSKGA